MVKKTNEYSTMTFLDIYESENIFINGSEAPENPIIGLKTIDAFASAITDDNAKLLYYLLVAKYGNSPIANRDIHQFELKMMSIIFQYGPTWEARLDIQAKLRDLLSAGNEADLLEGSKSVYNHAYNPSSDPSTDTLEELQFINDQNVNKFKRGKLEAYGVLWDLLKLDVTEQFLGKFKNLFKTFVAPEDPLLYITEIDVEEDE